VSAAQHRARHPREPVELTIDRLSHEGRGVARVDGKTVFVSGALAGETVRAVYVKQHRRYDEARTESVVVPSADRVVPRCAHADLCGGCSLQHLAPAKQIAHKESVLLELLKHQGGVTPEEVLPPLTGPHWGYRRKARLGVKYVPKKGGVLVGFREKGTSLLTEIKRCEVLQPAVGQRIMALRELVNRLTVPDQIPQIEVSFGDDGGVLVFRHMRPLNVHDRGLLAEFGEQTGLAVYLQPAGPESIQPLAGSGRELAYRVDDLSLHFLPNDFTQVNGEINRGLIEMVLEHLAPGPGDEVLDLFCGLGNFTLPIARRAGAVCGVEGEAGLVSRAQVNAAANGITNASFVVADLFTPEGLAAIPSRSYSKMLLDPPRTGAEQIVEHFDFTNVERLVYVSCNPVTLARDSQALTSRQGYVLEAAGVCDMFPHTAHVESIAVFRKR
jgi:23S rRNA (uracil1939-C5)-methyltransferase